MAERQMVPDGWDPLRWAVELERRAAVCQDENRPDMAASCRDRAGVIRDTYQVKPKREVAAE